ncbi:MAG: HAMP domain-containing histidine kinase, partial [Clostridia bacterium]|nr:HAMP domain-containing histidine kinase [Clostridia bacterium]
IWYTLVMIVASGILLTAMTSLSRDMVSRDITARLVEVVNNAGMRPMGGPMGRMRPMPDFRMYENGVHLVIYDSEFNPAEGQQLPFGITDEMDFVHDEVRTKNYDGNKYYVYDREMKSPGEQDSFWIKGIVSASDEEYAINSALKNNIILTVVLVLVAALGGYFIISRAFVPVNRIRETAKEISESTDLSRRIGLGGGRDEIHALADTFDEMLDRIENTLEREKQFTSDASHELRTPVAVILSECEYMKACAKTAEDYDESVDSVQRQAERMQKLISELLTISRMDKNTLQLSFEETDISELLSFVCDEQEEIHEGNITLERNIPEGITATVDRFLLARVFINLISNAYRYSNEDGKIKVVLEQDKERIVFTVEDNGIGISEEHIDKIWERFYQVDGARTADESGSMGLGLSMVKWIAKSFGGSASVESEPGKGSKFRFEFPVKYE